MLQLALGFAAGVYASYWYRGETTKLSSDVHQRWTELKAKNQSLVEAEQYVCAKLAALSQSSASRATEQMAKDLKK